MVGYATAREPPGVAPANAPDRTVEVVDEIERTVSDYSTGANDAAVFITEMTTTVSDGANVVGGSSPIRPSDAVGFAPADRWDPDDVSRYAVVESRFGHYLTDAGDFDAGYFGVTPSEATLMDPQHRVLMHRCDGPATRGKIPGAHFGVYVAISTMEYAVDVQSQGHFVAYAATGNAHSVASGRLSFTYGLHGPCVSVDTACSSALVATHALRRGVAGGECDQGLAAAVNLCLSRHTNVMFARAGMLTQDGRCKTLDATADGYVRQEACGVLCATNERGVVSAGFETDAPRLRLVVSSTAVNQDGRSSSLTAPNGPSQHALIGTALEVGGVHPADVAALQMHGTGTSLGDPIEIGAACDALVSTAARAAPPALNAVKSHVGHGETAAGLVGVCHAAAGISGWVVPLLHLRRDESVRCFDVRSMRGERLGNRRSRRRSHATRRAHVTRVARRDGHVGRVVFRVPGHERASFGV